MDITLIDPTGATKGLNAGLAYLAGSLLSKGKTVRVIDLNNRQDNFEQRIRQIDSGIVGVSLKSATAASSKPLIKLLNENKKIRFIICGGPHITVAGRDFIEKYGFDAGVIGEAENTIVNFLEYAEGRRDLGSIGNIWHRDKTTGDICHFGLKEHEQNLDLLPFPDYEVFDSFRGLIEDYPLLTSRGCPYQCIYCCVGAVSGRKWRAREVDNIIKELLEAQKKYHFKKFHIIDDNFTLDTGRAKDFCRRLLESGLQKEWHCPNGVRADRLDEELLSLMKMSGCSSINIGVESGVQKVFDSLKKGEALADIEQAIKSAEKTGIRVNGFFILGLPGSTYADDMKSLEYSEALGLNDALFNLISIYPGTELWENITGDKRIKILRDWTDSFHFGGNAEPVFETEDYAAKDRKKAFYISNLKRRHYLVVAGETGSVLKRALTALKIILKYDRHSFFSHAFFILKNMRKVLSHVRN
ncbi:MAG: radical SAM protein [Nitrospirae bacterium]|nr:radical SAM protein [Nitrospirota bacterium]MBI4838197.1 radical SAM protein [Nitrospirota bacterium]